MHLFDAEQLFSKCSWTRDIMTWQTVHDEAVVLSLWDYPATLVLVESHVYLLVSYLCTW